MPSVTSLVDKAFEFQLSLTKARGIPAFIGMLTRNNFMSSADLPTKRLGYLFVLKVCKLLFTVAGHSLVHMVVDACQPDSKTQVTTQVHNQAVVLQQALHQIPSPSQEMMIRTVSQRLAPQLLELGAAHLPDQSTVYAIVRLAWSACSGNLDLMNATPDELHEPFKSNTLRLKSPSPAPVAGEGMEEGGEDEDVPDDVAVCREALEVLAVAVALNPACIDFLSKDRSWHTFVIDTLLLTPVATIRATATDQLLLIATRCSGKTHLKKNTYTITAPAFKSSSNRHIN